MTPSSITPPVDELSHDPISCYMPTQIEVNDNNEISLTKSGNYKLICIVISFLTYYRLYVRLPNSYLWK
ncbi:MAG TPA: hypothetical protein VNB67_09225 [Nitrososphaeraceae archaeon]|jgi:hypothetical protein|nr:hypothetical protein [Nitrososphaeraceae archaeon]